MIDLDHFKNYNDSFGHECGDRLLHGLAQFVLKKVRAGDILCRWGGEEFTVVLPEAGRDVTSGRAEQLVAEVREFRPSGLPPVTVSIGSAVFPEDGGSAASLLRAADAALYRAKARGRDRAEAAWST
jgi:diguanylate cyclase (GGDEF)-like protein